MGTITKTTAEINALLEKTAGMSWLVNLTPTLFDAATMASNQATLQTAVNNKGVIRILTPGDYYLDGDSYGIITVGDDTTIEIGAGVTIHGPKAPTPSKPIFVNKNWRSNKGTISSITATYSAPFVTFTATETGHTRAVGDYVMIKGETTGVYNNVWKIASVTTNTWSVVFSGWGSAPANGTGTMIAYAANSNIHFFGKGKIDFNYNLQNTGPLGQNTTHANFMNKISNWSWQVSVINSVKYGLYYCNSYYADIGNVFVENPSSAYQGQGPLYNTRIHDIVAFGTGDDICPVLVNNTGYTQYDLLDADGTKNSDGDVWDTTIENITCIAGGSRRILVAGGTHGSVRRLSINNVKAKSSHSGFAILFDVPAGETAAFEDITINGLQSRGQLKDSALIQFASFATGTANIKNLIISNVSNRGGTVEGTTTAATGGMIDGTGIINYDGLILSNIDMEFDLSANMTFPRGLVNVGLAAQTCTLKGFKAFNINLRATGLIQGLKLVYIGSNANFEDITIENSALNGNISTFIDCSSSINTNLGINIAKIMLNNLAMNGSNSQSFVSLSGGKDVNLYLNNCVTDATGDGLIYIFGGSAKTYTINLANCRAVSKLINNLGTSHTFNVRTSNVQVRDASNPSDGGQIAVGTTSTWNFIGDNSCLGIDVSTIARKSGTQIHNTNAALGTLGVAGPVICQGTAANSWHLMSDPTKSF